MNFEDSKELNLLAGEYVLGTLEGDDRLKVEAELKKNQELRRAIQEWEDRWVPMLEGLKPVTPPRNVWNAVELCMEGEGKPSLFENFWNSLSFWRPLGLVASAAVLILSLYFGLVSRFPPGPTAPSYVALLGSPEAPAQWVARLDPGKRTMVIEVRQPPTLSPDQSLELWMIPPEGRPPISCGLLPISGSKTFEMTEYNMEMITEGRQLAVSLEPKGGSPTGQPTGPVLYQGSFVSL